MIFSIHLSGDGAKRRAPNEPRVLCKHAGSGKWFARLPCFPSVTELCGADIHVDAALAGIDDDGIAVAKEPDGTAYRSFRGDMSNHEPMAAPGKAAIRNQGHSIA